MCLRVCNANVHAYNVNVCDPREKRTKHEERYATGVLLSQPPPHTPHPALSTHSNVARLFITKNSKKQRPCYSLDYNHDLTSPTTKNQRPDKKRTAPLDKVRGSIECGGCCGAAALPGRINPQEFSHPTNKKKYPATECQPGTAFHLISNRPVPESRQTLSKQNVRRPQFPE